MTLLEAIKNRHVVRHYNGKPLSTDVVDKLNETIKGINKETGLHLQLITNESKALNGPMAALCNFTGCNDYILLVGKEDDGKAIGYYGEQLVLLAQQLGLNSCWIARTYDPETDRYEIRPDEKIFGVISIGVGTTQGHQHTNKPFADLVIGDNLPEWFKNGVECAMLAPTGKNLQAFKFELINGNEVVLHMYNTDKPYWVLDYGILKYHFEIGAGKDNFKWKE